MDNTFYDQTLEADMKELHKKRLKAHKLAWQSSLPYAKRTHYWTLIVKSTADGLYVGKECIIFSNREINI